MSTGKEPVYGTKELPNWILWLVLGIAGVSLALTCWATWEHLAARSDTFWKAWFFVSWAWWVFIPPIWFSVEYFYLFKPHGTVGSFEAFKHGQDLASRAWLGIAAVLSIIATK